MPNRPNSGMNVSGQHVFSQIPRAEIQRSLFDRSCGLKTTFNAGLLIPVYVDEALPGDTFNLRMQAFCRLASPLGFPMMENLHMDVFFFACPYRLLWDNFQKFCGEQKNPGDSTDYEIPQMVSPGGGYGELSIHDYFGLPTKVAGYSHMSLFHRMYNLVWNEWFRDQNLQSSLVVDLDDGPDNPADYVLVRRGKRHDYFTSCLPFPQKGLAVELPLGDQAPLSLALVPHSSQGPTFIGTTNPGTAGSLRTQGSGANEDIRSNTQFSTNATGSLLKWSNPNLLLTDETGTIGEAPYADLSSATAATINQIREAFQIQRLFERDARGGTRYTEVVRSHFGVVSPDARLQRPEFLGGGTFALNVNPVAQTAEGTDPVAKLAAFVTGYSGRAGGFVQSFTEHCLVLGLVCVRADLNYQQGLDRMWSRKSRFDFFWPALAHLGEQAVLSKEIYLDGTPDDDTVFGYQERWAEYRYKPSKVTGQFRSNAATPLDTWHLAQEFAARPLLNSTFIVENPPIDRVVAVPSEPMFLLDAYFSTRAARPMPTYSVPGLIDHF